MKDTEVIETRLKMLADYVKDLKPFQKISFKEFSENKLIQRFVERTLHLSIEACLDIGNYIISQSGFREPETNKDIFIILSEEKILPSNFSKELVKMAQFRNIIVHDYTRIDPSIVFVVLKKNIKDFDRFVKIINQYLETSGRRR